MPTRVKVDFVIAAIVIALIWVAIVGMSPKVEAQPVEQPRPAFSMWHTGVERGGFSPNAYLLKHHPTQTCWVIAKFSEGVSIVEAPKEVCQ